jgi:hypothetical protein
MWAILLTYIECNYFNGALKPVECCKPVRVTFMKHEKYFAC